MSAPSSSQQLDRVELTQRAKTQRARFDESGGGFDEAALRARLSRLEADAANPDLWGNRDRAQQVLRDKRAIERELAGLKAIEDAQSDAEVLLELAAEADDADATREAAEKLALAEKRLEDAELQRLLGGEYDSGNAIVTISAGAGGTDAADWAQMLFKMYGLWCESHDYKVDLLDAQEGDEAGFRSVTFTAAGDYAFGYLKEENGVHRLVRISPFDAQARRHTAFANVLVVPEIDDEVEVEVDEKDLRIDTYRSGGAGGQHVNKTDSAVRLTHIPTGIVVQCQSERSQHKNKSKAMKVMRARLHERQRVEQEERKAALAGEKADVSFGNQIRSYTLNPTQRVKDHRTDVEIGNAMGVLEGKLDAFIRASLLQKAAARKPGASA